MKNDPEEFATGGIARIGLKDGMNRRTFLKFLAVVQYLYQSLVNFLNQQKVLVKLQKFQ